MLGLKKNDKTYILINRKKQIKKGSKNIKKYQKEVKKKEKKETEEGNANEEEEEGLEIEEEERVLMLVKDKDLLEIRKIEPNFYENLDYGFVFKENISL
jgi:hypothetical protein